jgi:hypothetical protein
MPRPDGPAPQGQHWYYQLDRVTKIQCWHLGQLGLPVHKSAPAPTAHAGHGAGLGGAHAAAPLAAAPAAATPKATEAATAPPPAAIESAAAPPAPAAPVAAPAPEPAQAAHALAPPMTPDPATTATVAAPTPAPPIAPEPKIPPPQLALPQVAMPQLALPRISPPQTVAASESRSIDAPTPAPAPPAAVDRTATVVPPAAPIAQPTGAAAGVAEDHSFAVIMLGAALVVVLAISRLLSKGMGRNRGAAVAVAPGAVRKKSDRL